MPVMTGNSTKGGKLFHHGKPALIRQPEAKPYGPENWTEKFNWGLTYDLVNWKVRGSPSNSLVFGVFCFRYERSIPISIPTTGSFYTWVLRPTELESPWVVHRAEKRGWGKDYSKCMLRNTLSTGKSGRRVLATQHIGDYRFLWIPSF